MALPSGTDVQYLGANASGGMVVGSSSSELVAFHGATPTDQPAFVASVGTTVLEGSVSASAIVGYSLGKFSALVTLVNSMQQILIEKGLMASS
jgi:hypothetical protein